MSISNHHLPIRTTTRPECSRGTYCAYVTPRTKSPTLDAITAVAAITLSARGIRAICHHAQIMMLQNVAAASSRQEAHRFPTFSSEVLKSLSTPQSGLRLRLQKPSPGSGLMPAGCAGMLQASQTSTRGGLTS